MPKRGEVYAKAAGTAVTLQGTAESEITVVVNKHYEYSRFIEDFAAVQALSSARQFYTKDAGYQLAKQIDTDLIQLGRAAYGGTNSTAVYETAVIGGDGTTAYTSSTNAAWSNATALTDAGIRRVMQTLDDNDIPFEDRHLVVPPSARNVLMGLSRFTEQAVVGESASGNTIRNGQIGNIYGVDVYTTTNCDTALSAHASKPRICLLFHSDSLVLAMQQNIRTQTQYKQEYLADLLTSDMVFGTQILRNSTTSGAGDESAAFALIVPA